MNDDGYFGPLDDDDRIKIIGGMCIAAGVVAAVVLALLIVGWL